MSSSPRVTLMISTVSALAGRHKFESDADALIKHMIRYERRFVEVARHAALEDETHEQNLQSICSALSLTRDELPAKSARELCEELLRKNPQLVTVADATVPSKNAGKISAIEASAAVRAVLEKQVDTPVFASAKACAAEKKTYEAKFAATAHGLGFDPDKLDSAWAAARGVEKENTTLEHLAAKFSVQKYDKPVKSTIMLPTGETVKIFGRIDGMEYGADGAPSAVIEIKNRKTRFSANAYDIDQLALYVISAGIPRGRLVETCCGKTKDTLFTAEKLRTHWRDIFLSETLRSNIQTICHLRANADKLPGILFAKKYLLEIAKSAQ